MYASIAGLIVLILMSGYFSATETAFSAANRIKLKNMAKDSNKRAQTALKLYDEYDKLYEQLKITMDTEIRKEIITKMQQILIDDAATIVHGYYNSRMISNSEKVKNAEISTVDYYWLTKDIAPVLGENND